MSDATSAPGDADLREQAAAAIKTVFDPEIPVNLWDLGLIYELEVDASARSARVVMTLTTPNCPVAESMPGKVREAVEGVEGIDAADVSLTWEPAWTGERMSEDAKLLLEMEGISWTDPHGSVNAGPKRTSLTFGKSDRPRP